PYISPPTPSILMSRRPPTRTPFPYTTLFRSRPFREEAARARHPGVHHRHELRGALARGQDGPRQGRVDGRQRDLLRRGRHDPARDRKSTRLNSSHRTISYAVFCLKKKNAQTTITYYFPNRPDQNIWNPAHSAPDTDPTSTRAARPRPAIPTHRTVPPGPALA